MKAYRPLTSRFPSQACRLLFLLTALPSFLSSSSAQTLVEGAVEGVWEPGGNPFIVASDTWVATGRSLTVKPGVTVQIAPDASFEVHGTIVAKGTPARRISFSSPTPTATWSTLLVEYSSGPASEFTYCDFSNATNALTLQIVDRNASQSLNVFNCTFRDCLDYAVVGYAHGLVYQNLSGFHYRRPTLHIDVRNCIFADCPGAVSLSSAGTHNVHPFYGFIGNLVSIRGTLLNNIYENISATAVHCEAEAHTATADAAVMNSVFSRVGTGVESHGRFSVDARNNIFSDCTNGIVRTTTSGTANYNCFWNCATPFTGYSPNHGIPLLVNRNGTPCDIAFNIMEDPLFEHANAPYELGPGSPCVDAGDPSDPNYLDVLLEGGPARGNTVADQGAYGGADACNWLEVVAPLPPTLHFSRSEDKITAHWTAIPRNTYLIHSSESLDGDWEQITGGPKKPHRYQASHSETIVRGGRMFYRVEHLGRMPGD